MVRPADHRNQKERTRGQIDYRCAGDTHGRDNSHASRGRAHVTLPDNPPRDRVERVNIIGFRDGDQFRTAIRPTFDLEWLGVIVTNNRAVKVYIPRQIRPRRRRKGRINEHLVA